MQVAHAQREVRTAFMGGFMGQTVSGLLWLGSAALATWGTPRRAMRMFAPLAAILIAGGVALDMYAPPIFVLGGWFTGVMLLVFAVVGRALVARELAES